VARVQDIVTLSGRQQDWLSALFCAFGVPFGTLWEPFPTLFVCSLGVLKLVEFRPPKERTKLGSKGQLGARMSDPAVMDGILQALWQPISADKPKPSRPLSGTFGVCVWQKTGSENMLPVLVGSGRNLGAISGKRKSEKG